METTIDEIVYSLKNGQGKRVENLVKLALEEGVPSKDILEKGLLAGMEQITEKFRREEVGVPEILSITRAMNRGVNALKNYSGDVGMKEVGTAVLGTVNGDLHDIGKNLVKMMMESMNIQVIDLGEDVTPNRFLDAVVSAKAKVLILSGILETSAQDMEKVIDLFRERDVRDQVFIMVGGYHLNQELAQEIGADCYTEDAGSCAKTAYQYLIKRRKGKRKKV
ncbi:MAG: cobalamin-dependent protein [Lachnospiraceae bacterium]|nr:cobalamin-dependent protein [Lachnospiraceae bacterium]